MSEAFQLLSKQFWEFMAFDYELLDDKTDWILAAGSIV